jgi:prepilin-type processing-associated H-X9-DG protein
VSTYGVNGGSITFPPSRATNDGVFTYRSAYKLAEIADGTSNTLLYGERILTDGNLDSFISAPIEPDPAPPFVPIGSFVGWANNTGPTAGAGLLLGTYRSINYIHPEYYSPPPPPPPPQPPPPPPKIPWGVLGPQVWDRWSAYGSRHQNGMNVAVADGSVRFVRDGISGEVFRAVGTRAGLEVPGEW